MNRIFLISCIVIFVIVLMFFGIVKLVGWHAPAAPSTTQGNSGTPAPTNSGITVSQPAPNSSVSSPLVVKGQVTGDGWSGFEGQVGTVQLVDGNGAELARGPLTATTEWTTLPTSFEVSLSFSKPASGTGKLIFHNENPSGDPARDKTFEVPITFK
jgi:hypothetical protein